jgi:hypothetical protein
MSDTNGAARTAEAPRRESAPEAGSEAAGDRNALIRQVAAALANVAVLTALLVYFGWVRSFYHARGLGIDESILGMTPREYMLRSVRPVASLLVVVAVAGLAWVAADRWVTLRLRRHGAHDRAFQWVLRLLPLAIVLLPAGTWLAGYVWPVPAFVLFPLSIAGGLLLLLYAFTLRQLVPGAVPLPPGRDTVLRGCVAIVVGVALFTAAANYARAEGVALARAFEEQLTSLPRVTVHSDSPLFVDAPGVRDERLGEGEQTTFRYTGFRLLEYTADRHFLVSDEWSPSYGVVVVLEEGAGIRLDYVRGNP